MRTKIQKVTVLLLALFSLTGAANVVYAGDAGANRTNTYSNR